MASILPYTQMGPSTHEVSVPVTGGQLVEPDGTTGKVKPAGAGSLKVLGVAAEDGAPLGSGSSLNYGTARPEVAVYYGPATVRLTFAADCTFGATVIAAANGTVTPGGATPDASAVVGRCVERGGVLSGGVGLVRLR